MGAGQVGGIATLLDIDFKNAAGFVGTKTNINEAQYVVHYFSHALMFCVGTLIEPHVILTPAICVFGEKYKFQVHAGTHQFLEYAGITRSVQHVCLHKEYNHTKRWKECSTANVAVLVLNDPFSFHVRERNTDFIINRLRYGIPLDASFLISDKAHCHYNGWGSRRNGYLIPLLIYLRKVEVVLLPQNQCTQIWNHDSKFLCIQQQPCKSNKYGALCPDDLGTILECGGFAFGMMISRLVDRPCGVGFLDLSKYIKFITCGVDDAREVIHHDDNTVYNFTTYETPPTPSVITVPYNDESNEYSTNKK